MIIPVCLDIPHRNRGPIIAFCRWAADGGRSEGERKTADRPGQQEPAEGEMSGGTYRHGHTSM
jgi:hypothetical protein